MVPIRPVLIPLASRISLTIYVVVVFPFVPVIPTVKSSFAGYPKKAADIYASAFLVSSILTIVISLSSFVISISS